MNGVVKCALRRQNQIKEWLVKNNGFKILVTGKTGSGKTTLVNGLLNVVVEEEQGVLYKHTRIVTQYKLQKDEVDYMFYDTPGLKDIEKDAVNDSMDYSYLKEMVRNSQRPDLVVFTLKMNDFIFQQVDKEAMTKINQAFGFKIWSNAMIVLTHANTVAKAGHNIESTENIVYFNRMKDQFSLSVTNALLELKVQEDVANAIPVIPVGLVADPIIKSDGRGISWIEEFWDTLSEVLKSRLSDHDTPTSEEEATQSSEKEGSGCNCACSKEDIVERSSTGWCVGPLCLQL